MEKSDNELIAEFMGGVFYGPDDIDHKNKWWFRKQPHEGYRDDAHHLISGLKYHCDWSWIMPVVEKIESLEGISFDILGKASVIRVYQNNDVLVKKIVHHDNSKITHVYKSVIDFINFYNSQK